MQTQLQHTCCIDNLFHKDRTFQNSFLIIYCRPSAEEGRSFEALSSIKMMSLNLSVGFASDDRRRGKFVFFFCAALAVPEAFPFALPMKLERGTHCLYCTFTVCLLAHPKGYRWEELTNCFVLASHCIRYNNLRNNQRTSASYASVVFCVAVSICMQRISTVML